MKKTRKKKLVYLYLVSLFIIQLFNFPKQVLALWDPDIKCEEIGIKIIEKPGKEIIVGDSYNVAIDLSNYPANKNTQFQIKTYDSNDIIQPFPLAKSDWLSLNNNQLSVTLNTSWVAREDGILDYKNYIYLYTKEKINPICLISTYNAVTGGGYECRNIYAYQEREVNGVKQKCYAPGCLDEKSRTHFSGTIYKNGEPLKNLITPISISLSGWGGINDANSYFPLLPGWNNGNFDVGIMGIKIKLGTNTINIVRKGPIGYEKICKDIKFTTMGDCGNRCQIEPTDINTDPTSLPFRLCAQINQTENPDAFNQCKKCVGSSPDNPIGLWTAIGCIPTNSDQIIQIFIKLGLGIGGGIALLMILVASFQLSVSQGDPKQTNEAKDKITAAIIGLLFIIFSITILQFIGVKILHIPGFGE